MHSPASPLLSARSMLACFGGRAIDPEVEAICLRDPCETDSLLHAVHAADASQVPKHLSVLIFGTGQQHPKTRDLQSRR